MSDLMPCPFCARTPAGADCFGGMWLVECDCGCSLDGMETEAAAIAAWNRRVPVAMTEASQPRTTTTGYDLPQPPEAK